MRLDLNRPLFQDDAQQQQQQQQQFPTGGPYSPKTPPFFPDTFSKIETIETSYPYAQCTPPQPTNDSSTVDISDAPLPPSATPIETPTITMAMRIKETLDTVTANRSAAAQVSNEERVNRIKKGLEGLSFFRRPLEASS
jgi:hypothetical protein